MARQRVWLLSAYRADSHAAWADWLVHAFPEMDWTSLELPGRHFAWRIRGNPLSWLDTLPAETPHRILATSMVDLATLRGLHPRLSHVPVDYYFHENQFAYPRSNAQMPSLEPQLVQLYGALSADRLLFNSCFNRDSFLDGVADLLARMPDRAPSGVRDRLAARSRICPVPIRPLASAQRDTRLILWNHRWEYDKAPELFAEALCRLASAGLDFRVALLGRRHRQGAAALTRLRQTIPERIIADGRVPLAQYQDLLGRAGLAVSTAMHEFQGLAMLEAVSAGATPLVPDALCYPEQYADAYRYPAGDVYALTERLRHWLLDGPPQAPDVSRWCESRLRQDWADILKKR